jgi:hypothetical protein
VYDAAPELRQSPTGNPPPELEHAMAQLGSSGGWRSYARAANPGGGIEVWVTPDMPCDGSVSEAERVCMLPQGGTLLCDRPAALEQRGAWIAYGYNGGWWVAGIAPRGTVRAMWRHAGVEEYLAMADRVFGGPINAAGPRVVKGRVRFLR